MNILSAFVLFVILLEYVVASVDDVGVGFKRAVDERNFDWLEKNWERWKERKDLLDDVVAKGADVTVMIIQSVGRAKRCALAALFDKGDKGMIDDALERVRYNDYDLREFDTLST